MQKGHNRKEENQNSAGDRRATDLQISKLNATVNLYPRTTDPSVVRLLFGP